MKQFLISLGVCTCLLMSSLIVTAQPRIREDDHFWRRRVVNRVSLIEKINEPLVRHESDYYSGNGRYSHTGGMVEALIAGLKEGKYMAYDPDNWGAPMVYQEVVDRMIEFDQALVPQENMWDEQYADDFSQSEQTYDDGWNTDQSEWNVSDDSQWGSPFEEEPGFNQSVQPANQMPDLGPYEQVMHVVEDFIFDKNTSSLQQRIDFFELVWVDPSGTLPEKVLARFMWKDVYETLDQTMWKSRFNDAEARSVAEVFEMRIFHAFPIEVGGEPVRTLWEAEKRRQEMVEFEAYLWSN